MVEFIAFDWCGWNQMLGRFTHMPSGLTILQQPWMGQVDWNKVQLEFFKKFPGINVHNCPGSYNTDGRLMGSTDEICETLEKKLTPI